MLNAEVLIQLPMWCEPVCSLLGCSKGLLYLLVVGYAHGLTDLR